MRTASDTRLLVLHGVRLRGSGEASDIAWVVGLDDDVVESRLRELAADGLVERRDGALRGWVPTAAGRVEQERLLAAELDGAGCRHRVENAYAAFGALNGDLLGACTDWQVRGGLLNDHGDAAHDRAAVDRLVAVHERAQPVLDELEASLDRFTGYRPRLAKALARVLAGETDWFARPAIDSYHTVWFQLHEDLLNTLGRDRAGEAGDDKE
jgi:hypothetical protein